MTSNNQTQLSKWWMTESCARAYARVAAAKAVRIQKLVKEMAERKAARDKELAAWVVVQ